MKFDARGRAEFLHKNVAMPKLRCSVVVDTRRGIIVRLVAFLCVALCATLTVTACTGPADPVSAPVMAPVSAPVTASDPALPQAQARVPIYCYYQGQNYSVGAVVNFGGPAAAKCAPDGTWQGY